MKTAWEVFTGLKPTPIVQRPSTISKLKNVEKLSTERIKALIDMNSMHAAMGNMIKEISEEGQKDALRHKCATMPRQKRCLYTLSPEGI